MIRETSFLVLVILLATFGCSSSEPPGTTVQGSVKFNGKPVFPGSIMLKPEDGRIISAKSYRRREIHHRWNSVDQIPGGNSDAAACPRRTRQK